VITVSSAGRLFGEAEMVEQHGRVMRLTRLDYADDPWRHLKPGRRVIVTRAPVSEEQMLFGDLDRAVDFSGSVAGVDSPRPGLIRLTVLLKARR
jgi:hypothetical protein